MRTPTRPHVVLVAASLLVSGLAPARPAAAGDPAVATPPVSWAPCPDQPDVDCGSVAVPVDWARPDGGTIQVALARRPAADPSARIGSLLVDPGGPGASGVTAVKGGWLPFSPEIQRRFDVVGFDPRGVGASHPVLCDRDLAAQIPDQPPGDQAGFDALVAVNRRFADSCRSLTGPLFDVVDSGSVARDMEAVRVALGDGKLTFYGASYGSVMGEEYATRFGDRIRAMVLDGVLDHSISTTWQLMRTASTASEESFDAFVEWCDRDSACVLHGRDVPALFAALQVRAANGDLDDPATGVPLEPMDLRWNVNQLLYAPAWRQLATMLASLQAAPGPAATTGGADGSPIASVHQAAICEDWRLPLRSFAELDAYQARLAAVAPDMRLSPSAWSMVRPCVGWTGPVRTPQHPLQWTGAPPVLMLSSRFDPATGYEWAVRAARQSGATLLTYDGWGHGAYWKASACVTGATDRYLLTGAVPAPGTHCPAVPPTG